MESGSVNSPVTSGRMKRRLASIGLFVAIVWSISVAFIVLEDATHRLLDWGYRSGAIPDKLAMPTPSPEAAAKCATALQASAKSDQGQLETEMKRQVHFMAWRMGYEFGFAVGLERAGFRNQTQRKESLDAIEPMSQALRVPAPLPPFGSASTALPEYGQLIEDDSACTAAFLDHRHGAQVSHLYKLGALTSFAIVYRIACPQCGALFVPQIRHYGKGTGLPEETWQQFTQFPPDDASAETRQQKAMALLQNMEEVIKRMD